MNTRARGRNGQETKTARCCIITAAMIAFRHAHPALARGRLAALGVRGRDRHLRVRDTGRSCSLPFNMSDTPRSLIRCPPATGGRIGRALHRRVAGRAAATCGPWEAYLGSAAEPGGATWLI
jgi:hypothetical protein